MIKIELSDSVRPMSFCANCNQVVLIIHSISNYRIFQTTLDVARLGSKGHFRRFQTHVGVGATLLPVNQPEFLKINRKKKHVSFDMSSEVELGQPSGCRSCVSNEWQHGHSREGLTIGGYCCVLFSGREFTTLFFRIPRLSLGVFLFIMYLAIMGILSPFPTLPDIAFYMIITLVAYPEFITTARCARPLDRRSNKQLFPNAVLGLDVKDESFFLYVPKRPCPFIVQYAFIYFSRSPRIGTRPLFWRGTSRGMLASLWVLKKLVSAKFAAANRVSLDQISIEIFEIKAFFWTESEYRLIHLALQITFLPHVKLWFRLFFAHLSRV